MKEFAGKVAGITGAANGIGEAFALEAARRGMNLALIDIEGDRLQEVKKECEALGAPKVVTITVDVSEYEQVRMSVERIMAEFERIDVFYSNAGVAGAGTLGNIPAQDWDWITSVNFLGMAYYVTEVLPIMKKQGTDAYFLFTVSIGGLQPGMRIQSAYTASKHAAMSLAESVKDYAVNYAPYIGVTAFCPEYVNTTIWDSEKRRPEKFQKPYDPFYATSDYQDYLEPYVDYFNVSCGVYASAATMIEPCYSPEGWRSGFVKAIKSQVSVPIIAVNTVKHPQFAEQLLEEGVSDFVGMSRMHIADPYLVQKTMAGREDLIRKCLGCMNCNKSVVAGRTLHCALNPVAGHEVTFGDDKLVKNGNGRKVAIVGGGPAGMQAALLMKKRGFEPVIFEASGTLGGSAILASKAPCKHMAQEFVDTQIAEMKEYGIEVHLNTPGTVARIQTLEPYCVVVACGGNQIIPGVPGADRDNVYYIEDVLLGKVQFAGKKIAVIGGGHVGLEVAHYLCADNQVTVVEMQKEVGTSIYRTAKYKLLSLLQENGVEILTQHALAGVGEGTVELKQLPGGETVSVDADIVIMALGNRPDKAYEDKLAAAFDKVIVVGDATKAGTMADATKAAYEKCFYI